MDGVCLIPEKNEIEGAGERALGMYARAKIDFGAEWELVQFRYSTELVRMGRPFGA